MQTKRSKKASQQDWHPADILAALRKAGWSLGRLAFVHGLKDSSGLSIAMTRSFPKGEKRIADALGLHPKEIWPSRYYLDGTRRPQGIRAIQCTAEVRARNGNVREAA